MQKLLKIIIVILILFIPMIGGIFVIKKFFPADVQTLENQTRAALVQNILKLTQFILPPKPEAPKKKIVEEIKPEPIEKVLNYYTNQDVYKAICEEEGIANPTDKFLGCHHCPKYLNKESRDSFSLVSFASGSIIQKEETEAIFFMNGCLDKKIYGDERENAVAIVLRKGFGGWQKASQFKNILFDSPPLIYTDKQGFLVFVGIRKKDDNIITKETLFFTTFKNNKLHTKDIFSLQSSNSLKCSYHFLASMEAPLRMSEHKFIVKLDVLGWQDIVNSDCKIPTRNPQVRLKPSLYTLSFEQQGDVFIGDKSTQKIITELEKAQE